MDIAILYEKVTLKDNDKTFILKPIGTLDGKYEKDNGVFTSDGKSYYEYDDIKRLPIDKYFIGNPTTLNALKEFDPDIEDTEALKQDYMKSFVSDVILAKIKEDAVVVTSIDVDSYDEDAEELTDEIEEDNGFTMNKVSDDAELSLAILYEKTVVTGTENPTYSLRPIGVIYGFLNDDKSIIVNDTDRFISYYSKDNLAKSDTVYFGNVIDVRYLIGNVDINDNKLFKEISERYYATFENLGTYIAIKDDQIVVCQFDINSYTMQSTIPVEETENDEVIRDAASDALKLLDEELTDEEKNVLMEYYKLFARFLFIGYPINDITHKDVTANTYNYVLKTFNEMTMAIKGLGLDKEEFENLDEEENFIGSSNKEIGNNTVKKTKSEPLSDVIEGKVNDYDPNKVKYPKYTIEELYKGITDVVIGQDEQVMQIVSMLYKRLVELELGNMTSQFGMLITGSTGVGKSEILKMFASLTDLPIQFMDATQLTKQGYVGRGIEDYLVELALTCKGNMNKMIKAIMILDEVDKIRSTGDINDVSGKAVQDMMLKFMDGTTYQFQYKDNMYALDSKTMTTISAGAFTDLYHQKKKSNLGFGGIEQIEESVVKTKDFIDFGMTDEFMGRHYAQIHLNDLNSDTMLKILEMSKKSPIKLQEAIYKRLGVDAIFTDEYKKLVVEEAIKRKIGARSLAGIVGETTWLPISEIDAHRGEYNKVIFDGEVIENPKKYILRRD